MSAREITSADVKAGRVAPKIIHVGGASVEVPPGLQTNALTLAEHQAAQGKLRLTMDEAVRVGHRIGEIAAYFGVGPAERPVLLSVSARARGFSGDACPECGSFAMVRSGTCLTCQQCGSTSGCG